MNNKILNIILCFAFLLVLLLIPSTFALDFSVLPGRI